MKHRNIINNLQHTYQRENKLVHRTKTCWYRSNVHRKLPIRPNHKHCRERW